MNKKAFTLIELMIVIMVIAGLMYLIIPNITSTKSSIDNKTCDAYIELVNTQIQAYELDHDNEIPLDLQTLVDEHYIRSTTCPNGTTITYTNGVATLETGE